MLGSEPCLVVLTCSTKYECAQHNKVLLRPYSSFCSLVSAVLMEFGQKKVHCFKSFLLYAFSTLKIYQIRPYSDAENSSKLQIP